MDQKYFEWYFKKTYEDLESRIRSGTKYDLIVSAVLLRKLLFDSTPITSLVNREFRIKLKFEVMKWAKNKPEKGKLAVETVQPQEGADSELINLKSFLSRTCLYYHEHEYSVKDILHHIAYTIGGAHAPKEPTDAKEQALIDELMNSFKFGFGGSDVVNIGVGLIVPIAKVTLNALSPLLDEIKKEIGILPNMIGEFTLRRAVINYHHYEYSKRPTFFNKTKNEYNLDDLLIEAVAETEVKANQDLLLQLNIRNFIENESKDSIALWFIPPLQFKLPNGTILVLKLISFAYLINLEENEFHIVAILSNLSRDIIPVYSGINKILENFTSGNLASIGIEDLDVEGLAFSNEIIVYTNDINTDESNLKKLFSEKDIELTIEKKIYRMNKV